MSKLKDTARAAFGAGFQRHIRDSALKNTSGFERAWAVVSNIPGYFNETNAAVFWSVVGDRQPRRVVEIGSYQGRSTALLGLALKAMADSTAQLTAIDPHTGDRQAMEALGTQMLPSLDLFRLHTQGLGLEGILQERVMTAVEAAGGWIEPVDLLFDDGWHSYDAVKADADAWLPHLSPQGIVCFDDYEHYEEVRAGVDEACVEHGLVFYGTVLAQAWAGRADQPPPGLRRALSAGRLRRRLKGLSAV